MNVPTTSTVNPTTSTGDNSGGHSTGGLTSPGNSSPMNPTPDPAIACTATNVGAPRSVTFVHNAVYMRVALSDIPYIEDYSNLGNSRSVALQNFLAEALQGDFQTQTSGKFISILIQNIQPPTSDSNYGCTVVDFLAKFTSNLTPVQRTHIVQATYSQSISSNLPSLFGTLGTNPHKATRVSSVLYITPLNSAISPASPCVVFSSEGACKNGGTCSASGMEPSCSCQRGYRGVFCDDEGHTHRHDDHGHEIWPGHAHLAWPAWQITVVSIAAAIFLLLVVLVIFFCVRYCCCNGNGCNNTMFAYGTDRYCDYDIRARQMQMAPNFLVPAEPAGV